MDILVNMTYNFEEINANPLDFIKKNKKKDIIQVLLLADEAFFNGDDALLTDDIYEIVKDYVRKKYPKDPYLQRIGADIDNKVTLPYYMGSQNKIKDSEEEITKYKNKYKGPYVVSDKLDGVSCMVVYEKTTTKVSTTLYTRGNGVEGQDITHLLEYIEGFPDIKSIKEDKLAVRGELIISKDNWEKLKKNGEKGANPRNTVSGAVNSKTLNKTLLNAIDFVAYTLVHPNLEKESQGSRDSQVSRGLLYLKAKGFKIVNNVVLDDINLNILSDILQKSRDNQYIIDGIVVSDASKNYNIVKGKNPEHSFAFKSIHTLEQVEVIVKEVEWNISKDKYMKPIVKFDEIKLDDVNIKQATGFNAGFIEKNVIGPGSRIIIIRSGNVIPHINAVLSPSASGKPSMPKGTLGVNYKWNNTHVDIIMIDDGANAGVNVGMNADYDNKNILYFMKTVGVDNMGPGNIKKIYDAGFYTIKQIINITKDELVKIEGFKDKSAENIVESLKKVNDVDCLVLMDASNMLGRGFSSKKIKTITDVYPDILINNAKSREKALKITVEELVKVDGIAKISAESFIENLPKYYTFYDNLELKCKGPTGPQGPQSPSQGNAANAPNSNIAGKTFIFSGFRNKDYEKTITDNGGKVTSSLSKNTTYLIVKNKGDGLGKITKANELGVTILDIPELEELFRDGSRDNVVKVSETEDEPVVNEVAMVVAAAVAINKCTLKKIQECAKVNKECNVKSGRCIKKK
jgi:DNA ligase (NAD+)